jgi:hypothetical protein
MARYDDLNTKMIAYATVLSVVILVIVLQGTQALCYSMLNYERSRKDTKIIDAATTMKSEQLQSLSGLAKRVEVIDESAPPAKKGELPAVKKVIQIPIEEAQKLILKELGSAPGA